MKNELEKEAQTCRKAEVGFLRRCSQIPSLMHLCLYAGADGAPTTGMERSRGGEGGQCDLSLRLHVENRRAQRSRRWDG